MTDGTWLDWIVAAMIFAGAAFSVLAAIGVMRMPDFYMRLQATTKAATLGVACVAIAAALAFDDPSITTKSILVVAFLFLTAPVSAHALGIAAYVAKIPLWEGTLIDEMGADLRAAEAASVADAARESSSDEG